MTFAKSFSLPACLAALTLTAPMAAAPTPATSAEFGPHELNIIYTPLAQRALRSDDTNANAELDVIGRFRLLQGGSGLWGDTQLSFWALGNHTLFGTRSTTAFSRGAGLLWDTNDGDAPDPDWLLGIFALQQGFDTGRLSGQVELGKLYPGNNLATLPHAGDDRDSFMSQIIASDAAGRWYDRIGLGVSATIGQDSWFVTALVSDATAEARGFDFDTLGDGSNLVATEFGLTPQIAGRASKLSLTPYLISHSAGFSRETGLVLTFSHDLAPATGPGEAPVSLFGRYTYRTGGEPLTAAARDDARNLRHGGFLGVAFNDPFGRATQQVAVALLYGAASATAKSNGFGSQSGMEAYWKTELGPNAELSTGLQVIARGGGRGLEYIPGLRFKVAF